MKTQINYKTFQKGGGTKPSPKSKKMFTSSEVDAILEVPKGWSAKNPDEAQERLDKLNINGKMSTTTVLPEATVKSTWLESTQPAFFADPRTYGTVRLRNKEEAQNFSKAKSINGSASGIITDFLPGAGDVKGILDLAAEYKKTGKIDPVALAAVAPLIPNLKHARKLFNSLGEMRNKDEVLEFIAKDENIKYFDFSDKDFYKKPFKERVKILKKEQQNYMKENPNYVRDKEGNPIIFYQGSFGKKGQSDIHKKIDPNYLNALGYASKRDKHFSFFGGAPISADAHESAMQNYFGLKRDKITGKPRISAQKFNISSIFDSPEGFAQYLVDNNINKNALEELKNSINLYDQRKSLARKGVRSNEPSLMTKFSNELSRYYGGRQKLAEKFADRFEIYSKPVYLSAGQNPLKQEVLDLKGMSIDAGEMSTKQGIKLPDVNFYSPTKVTKLASNTHDFNTSSALAKVIDNYVEIQNARNKPRYKNSLPPVLMIPAHYMNERIRVDDLLRKNVGKDAFQKGGKVKIKNLYKSLKT